MLTSATVAPSASPAGPRRLENPTALERQVLSAMCGSVAGGTAARPTEEAYHRSGSRDRQSVSRRVLIVDDYLDVAQGLAELLETEGHQCHWVTSGEAALAVLPRFQPDVVVCDLAMPHMTGLEFARRVREDAAHRDVRLVAFTGFGDRNLAQLARSIGYEEVALKPDSDTVLRFVAAC